VEADQLQELEDDYEDLRAMHKDLKALCKAQAWPLKAKERECNNWAVKACNLDSHLHDLEMQGP
jgi:hypothetical protein